MIPYGRQSLDQSDYNAVNQILRSAWLTQGPAGTAFEQALASNCGARHAVVVSSGTAALHLAYLAADLKPGDELITSPNTFVATTNMALTIGVHPVFCDLRPDTCNLDENKLEALITPRTKVIVPVHFAGHPCALDRIWDIASRHHLTVIEDAAHALGAHYQDLPIGNGKSAMTIFSFHPVKSITTGEGGAIITNDSNLFKKLVLLRSHGITKNQHGFNIMTKLGYNYRLPDINAALGLSQLKKLPKFISLRHHLAKIYHQELKDLPEIILPLETPEVRSSWHLFIIRTKNPANRLPLYNHLKNNGIGVNFHYPTVYSHPYYRENGYADTHLLEADLYNSTAITIPLYPSLTEKQIKFISNSIKAFFNSRSHTHFFGQLSKYKNPAIRVGHLFSAFPKRLIKETANEISSLLSIQSEDHVLDIGGGTGEIARLLASSCHNWTLSDGSPSVLNTAKKNLSSLNNITFTKYDFIHDQFPWPKEKFNCILCYSVIHYLENYSELRRLLSHLITALPSNGRLLIGDIPLKEKKEKFLKKRKERFFLNFYQSSRYLIRKWLTRLFYWFKRISPPNHLKNISLSEEKIIELLKELPEIKYQFLEEGHKMEHAGSRINLLITKNHASY